MSTGTKLFAIAWTSNIEDSRRALAGAQPALATALKAATLRNRATYACSAINMDRWDLPGAEPLPAPEPAAEPAAEQPAPAPAPVTASR